MIFVPPVASADEERAPRAYVITSGDGEYYFKMSPDPQAPLDRGHGELFEVKSSGPDILLWKTEGWYSFHTYISRDGEYLVRVGNWPRGIGPSNRDLAVAFYARGKLTKSYSTQDVIKNPSAITASISHYNFLSSITGFKEPKSYDAPDKYHFVLTSVDQIEYTFDATTGAIVSEKKGEAGDAHLTNGSSGEKTAN